MNILTVRRYAVEHPEVEVVFDGASQLELLPLAWAVRSGDLTWLEFLDDSLEYLITTGRWAEIQSRYPAKLLDRRPQPAVPLAGVSRVLRGVRRSEKDGPMFRWHWSWLWEYREAFSSPAIIATIQLNLAVLAIGLIVGLLAPRRG